MYADILHPSLPGSILNSLPQQNSETCKYCLWESDSEVECYVKGQLTWFSKLKKKKKITCFQLPSKKECSTIERCQYCHNMKILKSLLPLYQCIPAHNFRHQSGQKFAVSRRWFQRPLRCWLFQIDVPECSKMCRLKYVTHMKGLIKSTHPIYISLALHTNSEFTSLLHLQYNST